MVPPSCRAMHLAVYQPVIPQNSGSMGRLCVGLGAEFHLIGPCGFKLDERAFRRPGLDHWKHLTWRLHASPEDFLAWLGDRRVWLVTKFGRQCYHEPAYGADDVILLGNEKTGLPQAWQDQWPQQTVFIPIFGEIRSYNQSNAASIVLAQAMLSAGLFASRERRVFALEG